MFTIEETQKLVESVSVANLTEDEKKVVVEDVHQKLTEAFEKAKAEGREAAVAEAKETLKQERMKSFNRGMKSAKTKIDEAVAEAEANGFEAGKEAAQKEAEENENEVSEELVAKLEELCKEFDIATRLVEIATHENTKEYFKESTKAAISEFVNRKVNESMPEKLVVDYDRLQQYQQLCESFKSMLVVNDQTVAEAAEQAKASIAEELNEAKASLKATQVSRIKAEQLCESLKAQNLLLKKVAKLPVREQKELLESFKDATVDQINENFESALMKLNHRRGEEQKAVVNDVICESAKAKSEAETKETTEKVNESVQKVEESAKPAGVDSYMARMAEVCKHMHL